MQDERTRLISPCLKAGVLRRDLINALRLFVPRKELPSLECAKNLVQTELL